jgi:tetratricopeptide (TPR) repeat protein
MAFEMNMAERRRIRWLSLLLLAGAILLAACNRNPEVRKQKLFNNAMALLKEGKSAKAVLQLRNALQVDPNFVEAANVLAELQARQGNYREAFSLLEQAEKTKPDYIPVRKGLAQLYKLAGKFGEAQEELDYVLEHTPDDTDALFNLGSIQASQKKYTDAEGTFNRILEIQPSHVQTLLALASIQEKSQSASGAERYLKLAVERNPRSPAVYLFLIKFYLSTGRPADAEALFAQGLKMTNNNVEILAAEQGFYEGTGRLAEAEALARRIQSSHAGDPNYRTALADYYVRINDWHKAETELERVVGEHKEDQSSLHKLIEVQLSLNDLSGAQSLNEALLKTNPKDSYAHLFKGRILLASGNVDSALLQFNEAKKFQPDSPILYYWYAQAYLRRRELQQAKQSLQTALKYDPGYVTARLQLADLENQTGALDAAMYDAKRALVSNPADTRAMLLYSQSLIQKQQYAEAAKVISGAAERAPNSAEVHRQRGILELIKKNPSAARMEFKTAWSLDPTSKPLLEVILLGYLADKQTGAASDFLQHELQARSNDPLLYHELAQVYLVLGKRNEAIAALQKALSLAPGNLASTLLLAETYGDAKQLDQALQLIAGVMREHAQDSDAMLRAGMLLEKLEHWEEAQKAYERAVWLDSGNAIAKNNLAWLLVSRGGNIDVALGLAQQAKEQLMDNVQVTATLGWIYYKKQVYSMAVKYLEDAASRDQKNATFQYELGMTQWKLGNTVEARRSLVKALQLDSHFPEAVSAVATLSQIAARPR